MKFISENQLIAYGLLNFDSAVEAVRNSFQLINEKKVIIAPKNVITHPNFDRKSDKLLSMQGFVGGEFNTWGLKWLSSLSENKLLGLPRSNAIIALRKGDTLQPYALLDGTKISLFRTVAVSLVMIERIKPKFNKLGILGLGELGLLHIEAFINHFSTVEEIHIYSKSYSEKLNQVNDLGKKVYLHKNANELINLTEVIICCSTSDIPTITDFPKVETVFVDISTRDIKLNVFLKSKNIIIDDFEQCDLKGKAIYELTNRYNYKKDDFLLCSDLLYNNYNVEGTSIIYPTGLITHDIIYAFNLYEAYIKLKQNDKN